MLSSEEYRELREYKGILIKSCFVYTDGGGLDGVEITFNQCHAYSAFESVTIQGINCNSFTLELSPVMFKNYYHGWQDKKAAELYHLTESLMREKATRPETSFKGYLL